LLEGEELVDALFGEVEHVVELGAGVGVVLGGGLGLDEAARGEHDDVHVDVGAGVLLVDEVEEGVAVDDADGGGGNHLEERRGLEGAGGDEAVEGDGEGDGGSGDGGGAGSAVGLEDVAVEDDGALAEGLHVDDGAERAADEALDLVGAAADLAAFGFAGGAYSAVTQPRPELRSQPGTPCSMVALQRTRVLPASMRTEPSGMAT
jgi:hypothetical protein